MGLLDSLFDPGSSSGGLLDFLRQNAMQQQAPSGLPSDQAQYSPMAQMPQMAPQAPPQMAPQMQPQNTMAQPAQGQPPPQGIPQQQALPPAFGGSSYLERLNNGGGLIGSLLGDTAQQKNLTAQYQAIRQTLVDNGEDPRSAASKAMLSVMNPEAGKTIINEALSNKTDLKLIKDEFGAEHPYSYNKNTSELKSLGGSSSAPGGQSISDKITEMRAQGATPQQMLDAIPTSYREDVKAMGEGRGVPANLGRAAMRGPLLNLTKIVYPAFDETRIPTRIQMRKDFAGEGKNGQAIGAFNTVQHHIDQVSDAAEEFYKAGGGSDYPSLTSLKSALANNTSWDPKFRDAAQKLNDKINAAEHEVTNAYNAGHITDKDRATWETLKASNLPANQLRQRLVDFEELLAGKSASLNHMYRTEFGEDAPTLDKKANDATLKKVQERLNTGQASYGGASNSLPQGWSVKVR